jgi:2-dehydropantoate 2-reductase
MGTLIVSINRLLIDGEVENRLQLTQADLAAFAAADRVDDVSQVDPQRPGRAVKLQALLQRAGVEPSAAWLTLHAARDNFHASVPLAAVCERGLVIFERDGQPLPEKAGGPFRFLVPDFAACQTAEVDECANVKFVDRIELTTERGFDNRPQDEIEHARLHGHE